MTTPSSDDLLFDVAAPPTPVERLLLLADQYVQHNDTLDRLLRAGSPSGPDAHAASAEHLASATRAAIKAVTTERLFESHDDPYTRGLTHRRLSRWKAPRYTPRLPNCGALQQNARIRLSGRSAVL
ncbi:hypothetical protein ACFVXC_21780 [Streptomyces sp. NPDC058257]|uniref:hypothetical protein n=1 Tax=Streptomyces sp. NPDC058257 TaxID=3346409 RepID=UPI0036EE5F7B